MSTGTPHPPPDARTWWRFLCGALAAILGYYLLSGVVQDVAYVVPGAVCGLVMVVASRRTDTARVAWLLVGAGQLLFSLADATFAFQKHFLGIGEAFPSVADIVYLAGYPVLALGFVLFVRGRRSDRWAAVIDATIIATGVGLVSWVFLMQPLAHDLSQPLLSRLVALAYPLADVLLLGVGAHLLTTVGRGTPALWLLGLGVVSLFAGDAAYGVTVLNGSYHDGSVIDAAWLLSSALLAAAVLHPSSGRISTAAVHERRVVTPGRVAGLLAASLVGITVMFIQEVTGHHVDVPILLGGSTALVGLALARMAGLLAEEGRRAEADRREQVRLAGEWERVNIARELHDLVGHALGGVLMQARGARVLLRAEPDRVGDGLAALAVIETRSQEALSEMRLMLGILRGGSPDDGTRLKRLRDVGALVDAARADSVEVRLVVDGDLDTVPPSVDTSAYRMVQEALTNAARHARGAAVTIAVVRAPTELRLHVTNGAPSGESSAVAVTGHVPHGIIGMRERVDILGGELVVGPHPAGGWEVRARIPLATG